MEKLILFVLPTDSLRLTIQIVILCYKSKWVYIYKCTRDKTNILPCCNYCKQTERHPTPIYKLHQNTKNLEILPTILQKVNKKPIHIIHHTHIHHTSYIAHIATLCQIKKKILTKYLQIG